ncbi:MAG TPA: hypothetical protein VGR45_00680 [Stellaceae bacterium]|nr:hypothetical protein [Stellaceae bacterium]
MPDFGIELQNDRVVDLRFEQFPERAREALERRIGGLTQALLDRVHGAEPDLTGKLRGETVSRVSSTKNAVRGQVRVAASDKSEYAKAGALEFGTHGSAEVKAHTAHLSHIFSRLIAPTEVLVAAYSRRPNIAARHYERGPLDAMRSQIIEELRAALTEAIGG